MKTRTRIRFSIEPIAQCVFCTVIATLYTENDLWFVLCENEKCQAQGPKRMSEKSAVRSWNNRG